MYRKIYNKLFSEYGKQKWWPTTLEGELRPSYHGFSELTDKQRFEIIIGAILTQNTSWKNVEKAIINLNKNKLLRVGKINLIRKDKLALLIRSAGYYNQKAERLKIIAKYLLKHSIKKLFSKKINELREELLSIKGIGPETADSIILYAAQKPIFVIDAYTKRIISRVLLNDFSYDELQKKFMKNLDNNYRLFSEYHALLVELAKQHCKTKPICQGCPLNNICKTFIKNKAKIKTKG